MASFQSEYSWINSAELEQIASNELIIFYPTRRQMATASAYYSEWAELPLLFLSRLFG